MAKNKILAKDTVKRELNTIDWKPLINAGIMFISALLLYLANHVLEQL